MKVKFTEKYKEWAIKQAQDSEIDVPFDLDGVYEVIRVERGGMLVRVPSSVGLLELNIQKDHIHMVMWILPKYSISAVMGFLKAKLSLRLFQTYEQLGKRY